MKASRRSFIKKVSLTTAGIYGAMQTSAYSKPDIKATPFVKANHKISIFSKNLQWLDYDAMAVTAAQIGFDGVDLTVRPNGHVLPERVKDDLPKAVAAVRKAGLEVYSIVTAISDANETYTESILSSARDLGIQFYRLNWFPYDQIVSIQENLSRFKLRMEKISLLNEKYKIHGAYQNHAGSNFGSSIWDLFEVLKNFDSKYIGSQYDVRHATVEGTNSWVNGFNLIKPYIKTYNIKDFQWIKKEGKWHEENVPLGEGMVNFKKYFELIKLNEISGPISIHYEYPLGGAENGSKTISISKEKLIQAMVKDLSTLQGWLK